MQLYQTSAMPQETAEAGTGGSGWWFSRSGSKPIQPYSIGSAPMRLLFCPLAMILQKLLCLCLCKAVSI